MSFPFVKPKKENSANVQAEFYRICHIRGIKCLLEYRHERCRFDAVIHDDRHILFIVEVKNYAPRYRKRPAKNKKQVAKYSVYGVPVIVIRSAWDIWPAINQIEEHLACREAFAA